MEPIYLTICQKETGKRIRELLKQNGYSVRDIQEAMGFENPQAVYKWTSGKSLPSIDNLLILSRLLHTDIESILVVDGDDAVFWTLFPAFRLCFDSFRSAPPFPIRSAGRRDFRFRRDGQTEKKVVKRRNQRNLSEPVTAKTKIPAAPQRHRTRIGFHFRIRRTAKAAANRMTLPGRKTAGREAGLSGISVNTAVSRMERPAEAISATTAGRSPARTLLTAGAPRYLR